MRGDDPIDQRLLVARRREAERHPESRVQRSQRPQSIGHLHLERPPSGLDLRCQFAVVLELLELLERGQAQLELQSLVDLREEHGKKERHREHADGDDDRQEAGAREVQRPVASRDRRRAMNQSAGGIRELCLAGELAPHETADDRVRSERQSGGGAVTGAVGREAEGGHARQKLLNRPEHRCRCFWTGRCRQRLTRAFKVRARRRPVEQPRTTIRCGPDAVEREHRQCALRLRDLELGRQIGDPVPDRFPREWTLGERTDRPAVKRLMHVPRLALGPPSGQPARPPGSVGVPTGRCDGDGDQPRSMNPHAPTQLRVMAERQRSVGRLEQLVAANQRRASGRTSCARCRTRPRRLACGSPVHAAWQTRSSPASSRTAPPAPRCSAAPGPRRTADWLPRASPPPRTRAPGSGSVPDLATNPRRRGLGACRGGDPAPPGRRR